MKKFSTFALLLLMVAVLAFAAVSCGDEPEASGDLTLEVKDMPQLMYIVGNDLDLSNGVLKVVQNGETKEVPMSDAGVSVSGYDKSKTGDQKVTLTYGGKSVEITVNVVERMQAIEFVTDYFVGDELDLGKGRLKITRDDGSSYTVILNNEKVKLEGFDSDNAGDCTVTATYETDSETYSCTFKVTFFEVEEVKLHAPNKIAYDSHANGLDLAGGYLTLKANNGALEKDVPLTDAAVEVTGFDLSVVTKDNPKKDQTLTVKFDGKEYPFTVKLTYTDISLFKDESAAFADINWENALEEWPEISEELGEMALELMEMYLDMAPAETQFITTEERLAVARAAFSYGMSRIESEIIALDDAFTVAEGGLVFNCRTPEAMEAAIEVLEDDDNVLYTMTPLVSEIITAFEKQELTTGITFGEFALLDVEIYESLAEIFRYMLDLHELFEEIPADWNEVGISTYATEIEAAYNFIFASEYADGSLSEIYYHISTWREADDAFEILYSYYYFVDNDEALANLASVHLPVAFEELASYITLALEQIDAVANFETLDTSNFFFNYYMALRTAEEILSGDNAMVRELYAILPVNVWMGLDPSTPFYFDDMLEYLRTTEGGFYTYSGALLDLPEYEALMDHYMEILFNIMTQETYRESNEYKTAIEEMFAMYVALTPTRQLNFLAAINPYYSMNIPPLAFDAVFEMEGFSEDMTCLFVHLLHEYYRGLFIDEAAQEAYNELVIAMELYAQRFSSDTWLDDFRARLAKVQAAYDGMNPIDKATFEQKLLGTYNKYLAISARYDVEEPVMPPEGEWMDTFLALDEAIQVIELSYMIITEKQVDMYNLLLSACERALLLEEKILSSNDPEILNIYYYEPLFVKYQDVESGNGDVSEDGSGMTEQIKLTYTFEYMMNVYRGIYVEALNKFMDVGIYDSYQESNLKTFENLAYNVLWTYMLSDPESTETIFDREQVLTVMKGYAALSVDEQTLFVLMESDYSIYYAAVAEFLVEAFTEKVALVGMKMLELEQKCLAYEVLKDEARRAGVEELLSEMQALYADVVSDEDKASMADLQELYDFYVAKAQSLLAEDESENEAA